MPAWVSNSRLKWMWSTNDFFNKFCAYALRVQSLPHVVTQPVSRIEKALSFYLSIRSFARCKCSLNEEGEKSGKKRETRARYEIKSKRGSTTAKWEHGFLKFSVAILCSSRSVSPSLGNTRFGSKKSTCNQYPSSQESRLAASPELTACTLSLLLQSSAAHQPPPYVYVRGAKR